MSHFRGRDGRAGGFTLIEVMVSVALVLLLITGVAQVFKMGGQAVGASTAMSNVTRDARSASATLADDLRNCVPDSPFFIISSHCAYASYVEAVNGIRVQRGGRAGFKNTADEQGQPFSADNPNNKDPSRMMVNGVMQYIPLGSGNDRVPRMDRVSFFARGSIYRGQMFAGSPAAVASTEAYVWYGHLALQGGGWPYGDTQLTPPEVMMLLPEDQFSSQRYLGRVAVLMKYRDTAAQQSADRNGGKYLGNVLGTDTTLAPFWWPSKPFTYFEDVAAKSIDSYRKNVNDACAVPGQPASSFRSNWYTRLDDYYVDPTPPGGPKADPTNTYAKLDNNINDGTSMVHAERHRIMRYMMQTSIPRPISGSGMSKSVPIFAGRCTQFIVEYAGDYLNQDPVTGAVTDALSKSYVTYGSTDITTVLPPGQTDGQVDFIVDPATGVKRIRWYGLPRDVNGDGVIDLNDVLPLADVMEYYNITANGQPALAAWESPRDLPKPNFKACGNNYANYPGSNNNTAMNAFKYVCAWHNDSPPMVRILMKLEDPSGRLQEGQWYEQVFSRL